MLLCVEYPSPSPWHEEWYCRSPLRSERDGESMYPCAEEEDRGSGLGRLPNAPERLLSKLHSSTVERMSQLVLLP